MGLAACLLAGCETLDSLSRDLNRAGREGSNDPGKGMQKAGEAVNRAADSSNQSLRK
jgi:predicted small secreted protein